MSITGGKLAAVTSAGRDERRAAAVACGVLGDALGVQSALVTVAAIVLLTLPLSSVLRPAWTVHRA